MLKNLSFFLLSIGFLLQSCQHHDEPRMVKNNPPDLKRAAMFNMQLGLGYLQQGDRPRAKKKLLIALKQEPKSPEINAAMAYYLEKASELSQAKKYYLKALTLSSYSGIQSNNYGAFLCRHGEYKMAEEYFLKAVKDPHYIHTAGAYENAGLCSLLIPDLPRAKQYFTKALNQDPSRRQSLYELVKIEQQKGHQKRALKLLQKYPNLASEGVNNEYSSHDG